MKVHLITPTGARPEALALTVGYMQRQTIIDWRWTILDDCDPGTATQAAFRTRVDRRIEIHRPAWRWKPGKNTQKPNMLALIDIAFEAGFDLLFVIEDDEWYAPNYLESMIEHARYTDMLIGQAQAHFYNVRLRHARVLPNFEHTALCRTAVNPDGALLMREVFAMNEWPKGEHGDRVMWNRCPSDHKMLFEAIQPLNVGIKGMPGRDGIGTGHDRIKRDKIDDPKLTLLRTWIGDDADAYARFYNYNRSARR
jgi:hypothetical protein